MRPDIETGKSQYTFQILETYEQVNQTAVIQLWWQAFPPSSTPHPDFLAKDLKDMLEKQNWQLAVLSNDTGPVALATVVLRNLPRGEQRDQPVKTADMVHVVVDKAHRGQGHADRLVEELRQSLSQQGVTVLNGTVSLGRAAQGDFLQALLKRGAFPHSIRVGKGTREPERVSIKQRQAQLRQLRQQIELMSRSEKAVAGALEYEASSKIQAMWKGFLVRRSNDTVSAEETALMEEPAPKRQRVG